MRRSPRKRRGEKRITAETQRRRGEKAEPGIGNLETGRETAESGVGLPRPDGPIAFSRGREPPES